MYRRRCRRSRRRCASTLLSEGSLEHIIICICFAYSRTERAIPKTGNHVCENMNTVSNWVYKSMSEQCRKCHNNKNEFPIYVCVVASWQNVFMRYSVRCGTLGICSFPISLLLCICICVCVFDKRIKTICAAFWPQRQSPHCIFQIWVYIGLCSSH